MGQKNIVKHKEFTEFCGRYLAEKRKELKIYQAQVAPKMGIAQQMLSRYENGEVYTTLETFKEHCEILNVKMSDVILSYEESKKKK